MIRISSPQAVSSANRTVKVRSFLYFKTSMHIGPLSFFATKVKKNQRHTNRHTDRQICLRICYLFFYHNTSSMCNVYRFKHVQLQYNYSLDVKLYVFDFSVKYVCSSQWSFNSFDISMVSFLCYSLESTLWKPWFRYMSRRFCQTYGS